jgi:hypothetical protein
MNVLADQAPFADRQSYCRQLAAIARAMATAQESQVTSFLDPRYDPWQLAMFVEDNLAKRAEKLQKQLELVAQTFEEFDPLILAYMRSVPLAAYDSGAGDGERMLQWLVNEVRLTPPQRDHIAAQQARHAVAAAAKADREGYVRFARRLDQSAELLAASGADPSLCVSLNPTRQRVRLHSSELLEEQAEPPADVLFFAAGEDIATVVLEPLALELIDALADIEPAPLAAWAKTVELDAHDLFEFCEPLVTLGILSVFPPDESATPSGGGE